MTRKSLDELREEMRAVARGDQRATVVLTEETRYGIPEPYAVRDEKGNYRLIGYRTFHPDGTMTFTPAYGTPSG